MLRVGSGDDGGGGFDAALDGGGLDAAPPDAARPDAGERDANLPDDAAIVSCDDDADCDDGVFCNGREACVGGSCERTPPVACGPPTPCGVPFCNEVIRACETRTRDDDGDGYAPLACGGPDCDDTRRDVNPDARERCAEPGDEDCNGLADCADSTCVGAPECAMGCPDRDLGSRVGRELATGTTVGAGNDSSGTCRSGSAPELAFRWVAPASGRFVIDTNGSGYDTVLYVRAGSCAGLELACDDDGGDGFQSRVTVTVARGDTLILFVDGFGSASGAFTLSIEAEATPREVVCNDGIDNDGDGRIDCADPDCAGTPDCCTPSPEICDDGVDQDCDMRVDCADPDCARSPLCCTPVPEMCTGGVDEDCDMRVDCADPDCAGSPACCTPRPEVCSGGIDEDCDLRIDCGDPDCAASPLCCVPVPEMCTGGRDEDCDGSIDCMDPDCGGHPACCVPSPEVCSGGRDEDCDGLVDCADPQCAMDPLCRTCPDRDLGSRVGARVASGSTVGQGADLVGTCGSTMGAPDVAFAWTVPRSATYVFDTEGSTYDTVLYLIDGASCSGPVIACDDDSGSGTRSRLERTLRAGTRLVIVVDGFGTSAGDFVLNLAPLTSEVGRCDNGIDDDGDGRIDCVDPDCDADLSCCVPMPELCTGGADEDCDGRVDCADPNCRFDAACCTPAPEDCGNFADDDCDGRIDCVDPDCAGVPPC